MRWGGPDEVTLKPPEKRAGSNRSGPQPDAAEPERDTGTTLVAERVADPAPEPVAEASTEAPEPRRSPENDPDEAPRDTERSPSAVDPGPGPRPGTTREDGPPPESRRRLPWGRRPSPGTSRADAAAPSASPSSPVDAERPPMLGVPPWRTAGDGPTRGDADTARTAKPAEGSATRFSGRGSAGTAGAGLAGAAAGGAAAAATSLTSTPRPAQRDTLPDGQGGPTEQPRNGRAASGSPRSGAGPVTEEPAPSTPVRPTGAVAAGAGSTAAPETDQPAARTAPAEKPSPTRKAVPTEPDTVRTGQPQPGDRSTGTPRPTATPVTDDKRASSTSGRVAGVAGAAAAGAVIAGGSKGSAAPKPAGATAAPTEKPSPRKAGPTEPDTVRTGAQRVVGDRPTESSRRGSGTTSTEEKLARPWGRAAAGAAAGAAAVAGAASVAAPKEKSADAPAAKAPTAADAPTAKNATMEKAAEAPAARAAPTAKAATAEMGTRTPAAAASAPAPAVAEPSPAERTDAIVPVADPDTEPEAAQPRPGVVRDRRRRRRVLFAFVLAALVLAAFLGLVALVTSHDDGSAPPRASPNPVLSVPAAAPAPPAPPPMPQLPRGGTTFFPNYRVVAYYGTADSDRLGVLGAGTPEQAAEKLEQAAAPFASPGRTVQPAMELIVGVVDGSPGPDGDYHHDIDQGAAQRYLATARAHKQTMIIDIQPGRSDFMTAVRPWENLLHEPDVSLALDPEWRMPPGEVPGKQIGTVSADEVNQVSTWLADIVRTGNLPQKLFVVHQFTPNEITNPERLQTPPQLAVVQHIDGFGAPPNKLGKYQELQRPQQMHLGFKLFYTEDTPMLTTAQALALRPAPDLVTYQ